MYIPVCFVGDLCTDLTLSSVLPAWSASLISSDSVSVFSACLGELVSPPTFFSTRFNCHNIITIDSHMQTQCSFSVFGSFGLY